MLASFPFSFNPLMTVRNVWTLRIIYINQLAFAMARPAEVSRRPEAKKSSRAEDVAGEAGSGALKNRFKSATCPVKGKGI